MKHLMATFIVLVLVLVPGISWASSDVFDMLRSVMKSDAVVVGRVAETRPYEVSTRERVSILEIDHVLFGVPASPHVELFWNAAYYEPEPGRFSLIVAGGSEPTQIEGETMLWFLRRREGRLHILTAPIRIDDVGCDELEGYLASLARAPRKEWHRHLVWYEVREYERPVLGVQNYLAAIECRRP